MVLLDTPKNTLKLLRACLPADTVGGSSNEDAEIGAVDGGESEEIISYVASLAATLADEQNFDLSAWEDTLFPYLSLISSTDTHSKMIEEFRNKVEASLEDEYGEESDDEEDPTKVLCDIKFSLAYGGKILLHQTRMKLHRGHRYALVGQNGAGKTTLMNAINNGKLEGWPTDLRTMYVDSGSNVDPVHEAKNVMTELLTSTNKSEEECKAILTTLKFTPTMIEGTIGELSGGWQMKLRLATAVLVDADILLLDEPTNHLDVKTVNWLIDYLSNLTKTTVIIVSHDTQFIETVCTDVIHYENRVNWGPYRKLVGYKGKMSEFVKKQPQAKHYFELSTTDLKFTFPDPGRLDGIRTTTQKILEMENVNFAYPGSDTNILNNVNLKMSLSSRVAILGANGAGKTTLVKMMVGDTQPTNVGQCKLYIHHNLRVAYVAQHSFHHVEQHYESSPANYIAWRFKDGYDKEKLESAAFKIGEEEQKAIDDFGLEDIWSRRMRAGVLEYEVKKRNVREKDNKFYSKDELLGMGFEKLLKQTDEKIAAREAGLDIRPVTTKEIQKHLDNFGLAQEFGTYGKIRGLSGGQKVKLVIAAAMWCCPHLLVLDEPTNYLDREALGALSSALNEWGGAVLMISHNKEFYSSVCKEEWYVADGVVKVKGISSERKMKAVAKKKVYEKEDEGDIQIEKAGGNLNADGDKYRDAKTDFWGKSLAKKDVRKFEKAQKKGDVAAMRKILLIPVGKVMPGFESLGDGK